jgi:hypothetical protein
MVQRAAQLCELVARHATLGLQAEGSQEIRELMDAITCFDLGLASAPAASIGACITTHNLHECSGFEIVVFRFSAGASIPLHDHPGMTVFSKVLYGSLRVQQFDMLHAPPPRELDGAHLFSP